MLTGWFCYQEAVASILESGLKWQKLMGRESPIWLQKLFRFWKREKEAADKHKNLINWKWNQFLSTTYDKSLQFAILPSDFCEVLVVGQPWLPRRRLSELARSPAASRPCQTNDRTNSEESNLSTLVLTETGTEDKIWDWVSSPPLTVAESIWPARSEHPSERRCLRGTTSAGTVIGQLEKFKGSVLNSQTLYVQYVYACSGVCRPLRGPVWLSLHLSLTSSEHQAQLQTGRFAICRPKKIWQQS